MSTQDTRVQKAIEEVNKLNTEIDSAQSKTDLFLERLKNLPEYADLYNYLRSRRDDSRGFFQTYVVPAWNYLTSLIPGAGLAGARQVTGAMGFIPLIPIAAVIGSSALLYAIYAYRDQAEKSLQREREILDDPKIPSSLKRTLLGGATQSNLLTQVGVILGVLVLVPVAFSVAGRWGK